MGTFQYDLALGELAELSGELNISQLYHLPVASGLHAAGHLVMLTFPVHQSSLDYAPQATCV